jgi:hypothetical protein
MKRDARRAIRRLALVIALVLGLAIVCSASADADPSPSGRSPAVTVPAHDTVGIADAVCVKRGPSGPEPCLPANG